jgi:hypothetical protein
VTIQRQARKTRKAKRYTTGEKDRICKVCSVPPQLFANRRIVSLDADGNGIRTKVAPSLNAVMQSLVGTGTRIEIFYERGIVTGVPREGRVKETWGNGARVAYHKHVYGSSVPLDAVAMVRERRKPHKVLWSKDKATDLPQPIPWVESLAKEQRETGPITLPLANPVNIAGDTIIGNGAAALNSLVAERLMHLWAYPDAGAVSLDDLKLYAEHACADDGLDEDAVAYLAIAISTYCESKHNHEQNLADIAATVDSHAHAILKVLHAHNVPLTDFHAQGYGHMTGKYTNGRSLACRGGVFVSGFDTENRMFWAMAFESTDWLACVTAERPDDLGEDPSWAEDTARAFGFRAISQIVKYGD